jgi:hypothetical protein
MMKVTNKHILADEYTLNYDLTTTGVTTEDAFGAMSPFTLLLPEAAAEGATAGFLVLVLVVAVIPSSSGVGVNPNRVGSRAGPFLISRSITDQTGGLIQK